MALTSLNRYTAFCIHLAISAMIAATVVALVLWLWYPAPYFKAMGGDMLLRLLIGVDVVLGPVITLIIFDTKKRRLHLDLAVVAALQVAALAYGAYIMFEARPVYTVFVKDRFEVVPANGIEPSSQARASPAFRALPLSGPLVIAAQMPRDPNEAATITMAAAAGGPDVAQLPHLYEPYANASPSAAKAARPLVSLSQKGRETATAVDVFVTTNGNGTRSLGYVPVRARNKDFAAVVDRKTGDIVGYLAVDPW